MRSAGRSRVPLDHFRFIYFGLLALIPITAVWMARKPAALSVPVLRQAVQPYHLIRAEDLTMQELAGANLSSDFVTDQRMLVNHYTRQTIAAGVCIKPSQVVQVSDPNLIIDTIAVSVPAKQLAVQSSAVAAGDVVNVATLTGSEYSQAILPSVLVLDGTSADNQGIVLAIPKSAWIDYLRKTRDAPQLVIAKSAG
jgi:hypothetical protein